MESEGLNWGQQAYILLAGLKAEGGVLICGDFGEETNWMDWMLEMRQLDSVGRSVLLAMHVCSNLGDHACLWQELYFWTRRAHHPISSRIMHRFSFSSCIFAILAKKLALTTKHKCQKQELEKVSPKRRDILGDSCTEDSTARVDLEPSRQASMHP